MCNDNYKLKSNNTCVKIVDYCVNFDAELAVCLTCDSLHYLTKGICCSEKQYGGITTGVMTCQTTVAIPDCIQYLSTDSTKCAMCIQSKYLNSDQTKCVTRGKYLSGTNEVAGKVQFCDQYGTSDTDCTQCIRSHTLMNVNANKDIVVDETLTAATLSTQFSPVTLKKFCMRTDLENCKLSSFNSQTNASTQNELVCNTCKRNYIKKALSPTTSKFYLHYKIDNCKHSISSNLYSLSSFQCFECENDYYLDKVNNLCVLRTATYTNNCVKYDLYADKCLICKPQY